MLLLVFPLVPTPPLARLLLAQLPCRTFYLSPLPASPGDLSLSNSPSQSPICAAMQGDMICDVRDAICRPVTVRKKQKVRPVNQLVDVAFSHGLGTTCCLSLRPKRPGAICSFRLRPWLCFGTRLDDWTGLRRSIFCDSTSENGQIASWLFASIPSLAYQISIGRAKSMPSTYCLLPDGNIRRVLAVW